MKLTPEKNQPVDTHINHHHPEKGHPIDVKVLDVSPQKEEEVSIKVPDVKITLLTYHIMMEDNYNDKAIFREVVCNLENSTFCVLK